MRTILSITAFATISAFADVATPPQMPSYNCMEEMPKSRSIMGELYGECLFLQPNGSDLYYAAEALPFDNSIAVPAVSPNWRIFEISPNYSPAFKVGTKIFFSDMDTNIEASWQRLFSRDSSSYNTQEVGDMIGPMFDIGPNSSAYADAKGKAVFHFDAANLVFGQQFCAFKRLYPNLFAGAGFARIKQKMSATYLNVPGSRSRTVSTYSTFMGAGPQMGFDFAYRIVEGFFFTGNSTLSLLIGSSSNKTTFTSYTPFLVTVDCPNPNIQETTVPNRTQLVPAIEEKLGFSYALKYDSWKITFAAGYQAQAYLNAVQTIDMTAPQAEPSLLPFNAPDSGVFAVGFERTLSNFLLTGPYISLDIVF